MKIDIVHIAKLANLSLTTDESEKFSAQLTSILEHVEKLSNVDTTGVEETSQVTGLTNIGREDKTEESLSQEDALSQAKNKHKGQFMVKGVFDSE